MRNKILNTIFIFLVIAVLVWLAFYLVGDAEVPANTNQEDSQSSQEDVYQEDINQEDLNQESLNQAELFENYIRANIDSLSPVPAVLGGTHYVTKVEIFADDFALVEYEDGHIALQALINFDVQNGEIVIKSFEVKPEKDLEETSGQDEAAELRF